MKSNIKKKSRCLINICLILSIFMSISIAQALVSADRTIEKNVLTAGSETYVTVFIKNDNTQPLAVLKESIPAGWNITRISDDADGFKITNEWVWVPKTGNYTDKNVKYRINIPVGTASGKYIINGTINEIITVTGDNTIEVSGGSGGGSSDGSSGDGTPTITSTPVKSANVTGSPTETVTAQPTVTIAEQITPKETAKGTATTNTKSPGFGIIFSIGIIAAIYLFRRMKQ